MNIFVGDDVNQLCQINTNSIPVDLTSIFNLSSTFGNDPSQANATQTFSLANGGITLSSKPVQGTFNLIIAAAQSAQLDVQTDNLDFVAQTLTQVLATTGTTILQNTALTGLASTTGVVVGQGVTGVGIPVGTTVAALVSGTAITLSQNATASAMVSIIFGNLTSQTYRVPNGLQILARAP